MLLNETDLEPCCCLIHSLLGRLMPIGVDGVALPPSAITVMAFAIIPFTFFFLSSGKIGEWSSNHCAWEAIFSIVFVAARSFMDTTLSQLPFLASGSKYTSM